MKSRYLCYKDVFKALADENRVMIVEYLAKGELCACELLEKFHISQSTLSHHMKVLCDCGLVSARKEGKWTFYSINIDTAQKTTQFFKELETGELFHDKDSCEKDCTSNRED